MSHDSFTCVTRPIHQKGSIPGPQVCLYSYVWYKSVICVPWLIHVPWRRCHGSLMCVSWLMHVPWLIHMCALTHSCVQWLVYMCAVTHLYVCRDSFICVPWLIHPRPMAENLKYVWRRLWLTLVQMTRIAVCCSVLQCVAAWCSLVQSGAVWCCVVQCVAVCCSGSNSP